MMKFYIKLLEKRGKTPWKYQKTEIFSDSFGGQRKGALEMNGLEWLFCYPQLYDYSIERLKS